MLPTPDKSTKIIVLSFLDGQDKTEVEENRLIVTTDLIPKLNASLIQTIRKMYFLKWQEVQKQFRVG